MSGYMNPLGAKYGERIIDGVKRDLRGILDKTRKEALADGYPPGTVPMPKQQRSPLLNALQQ